MLPKKQAQCDGGGQTSNGPQWEEGWDRGKPPGCRSVSEGPNSGGGDMSAGTWRRRRI